MGHVRPSGVTSRFSHGLHECGEQAATAPPPACVSLRCQPPPARLPAAGPADADAPRRANRPRGKPARRTRAAACKGDPPHQANGTAPSAHPRTDGAAGAASPAYRRPPQPPGPRRRHRRPAAHWLDRPRTTPASPLPTLTAKPRLLDPQHHLTHLERSRPARPTNPWRSERMPATSNYAFPRLLRLRPFHVRHFHRPRVLYGFADFGPHF